MIEVIDVNNFVVDMITVATTTDANAGWTGNINFLLPIGLQSNTPLYGYGAEGYGESTYGTPRAGSGVVGGMRQWSLTNFGEDLLANPRQGAIYWWDASNGTGQRASIVTGKHPTSR